MDAPIALFVLAAYPTLDVSGWLGAVVAGWRANARLLHVHLITSTPPPPSFAALAGPTVRVHVVEALLPALLEFAGVRVADVPRAPRAASLAPLLPDFAESVCGIQMDRYTHFGTMELDVILGDLAPFVAPYLGGSLGGDSLGGGSLGGSYSQTPGGSRSGSRNGSLGGSLGLSGTLGGSTDARTPFDAVALRWAPPRRRQWRSAHEALVHNTLADGASDAVLLSTPLLIIRNSAAMRRLWWTAEHWLRSQERPGAWSLRMAMVCRTCTGPLYWFDEHNLPNFWRHELPRIERRSLSVAFACCALADHHIDRADGCNVTWRGGAITRACESAAQYAWDGAIADGGRCARNGSAEGACAHLARHGAPPAHAAACSEGAVRRASFGHDVAARLEYDGSGAVKSTAVLLGAGDSAGALLEAASGGCAGGHVSRSLAAFHAARSKRAAPTPTNDNIKQAGAGARVPLPATALLTAALDRTIELHPRFLAPR